MLSLKCSTLTSFSLMIISSSTFLGLSLVLLTVTMLPPVENTLSDLAEEAEIASTILDHFDRIGKKF